MRTGFLTMQRGGLPTPRKGVNDLIRWMGAGLVARIVFEATGRYHAAVERHLGAAGYPFVKVNPRQAKRFGEALGTRAKTDRMDAAMLARMGMALDLDPGSACPENLLVLSQTLTARRALIKDRTAAKNRAEGLTLAILRKQNLARQKRIELDIAERVNRVAGYSSIDDGVALGSHPRSKARAVGR